jgi:glycosyltransferase involved in cell wall biosynthesis
MRPVAMVVHAYYEEDPRVRREAEALVASGRRVVVYALRRPGSAQVDEIEGVAVRRLGVRRHQGAPISRYLAEYVSFLVRASAALTRDHVHERYAAVQVHSLPDFLVGAALPLRLVRVPVLLDLHEAMPDFFRYRFPRADSPLAYRALLVQERVSLAMASTVITVNDPLGERLLRLGLPARKLSIIRNLPALSRFDPDRVPRRAFMEDGVLRLVYAGALSPTYEIDIAIRAVAALWQLRPTLPVTLDLYGRDFGEVPLNELATELGVAHRVRLRGRVPIEDVPAAMAAADIGLAPTRRNAFTEYSLSTKLLEYLALGKPAVATRLPLVERTFDNGEVALYEPGDAQDLAATILRLVDDVDGRTAQVARAASRVAELAWEREAERYVGLVEDVIARRPRAAGPRP